MGIEPTPRGVLHPDGLADLLLCMGSADPAALRARLEHLSPAEWQALAGLAARLGAAPLLFHRLQQAGITPPPLPAAALRQAFLHTTAHNMRLFYALGEILEHFKRAGIPLLLLKGAALAQDVYGEPGARPMGDLDLLLHEPDLHTAIALMQRLGYRAERAYFQEADGEMHYHAPPMFKDGVAVELHWSLALEDNLPGLDTAVLWEGARSSQVGGAEALSLAPAHLLLHLCVHAAYGHQFHLQFRSLLDVLEVLRVQGDGLDWDEFSRLCRAWQAERGTYLCLRLVQEFFTARVPPAVLQAVRPADWTEQALEWARVRLFQVEPVMSETFIRVMHGASPGERANALLKGLFPSRAVMARIYGHPPRSWRILARYPAHAAGRVARYAGRALRSLRGDPQQAQAALSDQALRDWLQIKA